MRATAILAYGVDLGQLNDNPDYPWYDEEYNKSARELLDWFRENGMFEHAFIEFVPYGTDIDDSLFSGMIVVKRSQVKAREHSARGMNFGGLETIIESCDAEIEEIKKFCVEHGFPTEMSWHLALANFSD